MPFDDKLMSGSVRPLAALKWSNWYLIALKLAIGLLLVLLMVLFWVLHQNEVEEQRSTLIADVLWLEQSINFHLEGVAENLEQLARDLPKDALMLCNLSGRGDKDVHTIAAREGITL